MNERPKSVTIISWFYIIGGVYSLGTVFFGFNVHIDKEIMFKCILPISIIHFLVYISILVNMISGIGMLLGNGWCRLFFAVVGILGFLGNSILMPMPMKLALIPQVSFFAIVLFLLFRPKVNQFFLKG